MMTGGYDYYGQLKDDITKELLQGKSIYVDSQRFDSKKWTDFLDTLADYARSLIREINKSKKIFRMITKNELMSNVQFHDNQYYFDFCGDHGMVRFVFNRKNEQYIQFDRIEEEIFDEVFLLV